MPVTCRGGGFSGKAARRQAPLHLACYSGMHTHTGALPGAQRTCDAAFWHRTTRSLRVQQRSGDSYRTPAVMMPVGVPRVPYRGPSKRWQWVDIWNCLYRERIMFIGKGVDDELGNQLVATMLYLDSENQKPINIYLNTSGGEVVPCLALYDTFKHIRSEVHTVGFGGVMGMAGFLLACGEKGKRYALDHTSIMLHHPSGTAGGQADDVHNEGRELLRLRDYMDATLSVATGRSFEAIQSDLERVLYMSTRDAVEYGVIDHVIKMNPKKLKKITGQ